MKHQFDVGVALAELSKIINAEVAAFYPPGTPNRKNLMPVKFAELWAERGGAELEQELGTLRQAEAEEITAWKRAWQREQRRKSPAVKMAAIARRLQAAGLAVRKSNRTESRYVGAAWAIELRISFHHLGVADYGTREQFHRGPEVVAGLNDSPYTILQECLTVAREAAGTLRRGEPGERIARADAASLLRGLRKALDRVKSDRRHERNEK